LKIRRKNPACLNCRQPLQETANFCPACGQENNDRRVSFRELAGDVLNSLFSYDSQFAHSLLPFLFFPGKLTNEFLQGRRKRYIHPLRLYFACSFIFFLLFSLNDSRNNIDFAKGLKDGIKGDSAKPGKNIGFHSSSTGFSIRTEEEDKPVKAAGDSVAKASPSPEQVKKQVIDSIGHNVIFLQKDTLARKRAEGILAIFFNEETGKLAKNRHLTPDQLLDTLSLPHNFFYRLLARQSMKLTEDGADKNILNYALGKIPLMMFILMPVVALLLKLIYMGVPYWVNYQIRHGSRLAVHTLRKQASVLAKTSPRFSFLSADLRQPEPPNFTYPRRYYIEHLIFTLTLHSFIFFLFSLIILAGKLDLPEKTENYAQAGLGIVGGIYFYLSFKNVYKQGWLKTGFKILLLSLGYAVSLALCATGLVVLSLAFF
jgi:hypothetical protein